MRFIKTSKGFSFIEIILAIGVLTTLFAIITINLISASRRVYNDTTTAVLISDLRTQQVKAMIGDTEKTGESSMYGVYFGTDRYTLFRGNSYSVGNPTNFVITLPGGAEFSNILFPNFEIVFASGSGEIAGFSSGLNSVTIINTSENIQKNVTLNRFGVITSN